MELKVLMNLSSMKRFCQISLFLFALTMFPVTLIAQQTVLYQSPNDDYERMIKEYDQGLFGRAARSAEKFLNQNHDPVYTNLIQEAQLLQLKSWLRMEHPGTIAQILAFADEHAPEAIAQRAIMMIGEDAFDHHRYEDAINILRLSMPVTFRLKIGQPFISRWGTAFLSSKNLTRRPPSLMKPGKYVINITIRLITIMG